MRQIAEFVAVLACGLFTGAAVYISLVEHPARMECGVELAATEFAPSYRRATVMQVSLAAVGLVCFYCSMACRGVVLMGRCRSTAGLGHPIHGAGNPADQRAVVESCIGQAVGRNGAATRGLGYIACR
jgi:hypothetical protein